MEDLSNLEVGLRKILLDDSSIWQREFDPSMKVEDFGPVYNMLSEEEKLGRAYSFWFIENGVEVGFLQVFGVMRHPFQSGYIEISIFENQRKKGLGKKAIMALEKFSFEQLKIKKLIAPIHLDNTASISLFKSLGYEKTHTDPYAFFIQGKPVAHEIYIKLGE